MTTATLELARAYAAVHGPIPYGELFRLTNAELTDDEITAANIRRKKNVYIFPGHERPSRHRATYVDVLAEAVAALDTCSFDPASPTGRSAMYWDDVAALAESEDAVIHPWSGQVSTHPDAAVDPTEGVDGDDLDRARNMIQNICAVRPFSAAEAAGVLRNFDLDLDAAVVGYLFRQMRRDGVLIGTGDFDRNNPVVFADGALTVFGQTYTTM